MENEQLDTGDALAPIEHSYSTDEVVTTAQESLDFLAALVMPLVYQYAYPPVFLAVWQWLTSYAILTRDFSKLALGLPRGFGKTTLLKIFIIWAILFTKKKFILIVAANASLAENILADVVDMLDELNIKRTFGDWRLGCTKDTGNLKKFGYRGRGIMLAAMGAGGALRGLNLKNERPDIMVFEDVQTREQADSTVESDALYRWMLGTAMKAKSPHGCLYIFVANMYPTPHSILRKLKASPSWTKFITGAILENGESIWEELQPIKQLMEEFAVDDEAGHPEIFYAEILNDETASVANKLDITRIVGTSLNLSFPPQGKYIIIDPATDKPGANDTAIGLVYVYDGVPILVKLISEVLSPMDTIQRTIQLAMDEGCRLICIESVAYQYTFLYWFNFVSEQLGIVGIYFVELRTKGVPKNTRIKEGFKKLVAGDIGIVPALRGAVADQYSMWNPLKKDNKDDILDIVGYLEKPMDEYGDMITYDLLDEAAAYRANGNFTDVVPAYLNCSF
jgi:hypothetical protein